MNRYYFNRFIFLFFLTVFHIISIQAQKKNEILEYKIAELILRLDTINCKVVFDTNSTNYFKQNFNKHIFDTSIVGCLFKESDYTVRQINYKKVIEYLPKTNVMLSQHLIDSSNMLIESIYRDREFSAHSDHISNEISKAYLNEAINLDSLNCLFDLILSSSLMENYLNKEHKLLVKRFVVHSIYEFEDYYLVNYYLLKAPYQEIGKPFIEIMFK